MTLLCPCGDKVHGAVGIPGDTYLDRRVPAWKDVEKAGLVKASGGVVRICPQAFSAMKAALETHVPETPGHAVTSSS